MPYNLDSPNGLVNPIDFNNVEGWLISESLQIDSSPIRHVVQFVAANLDAFVYWPQRAVLLWQSCDRVKLDGEKQKYHSYPDEIRRLAKQNAFKLDTRANGPARASFVYAGGIRPERFGSSNAYTAHHLYSGKFPYPGRVSTLHGVKSGSHFTQSAGIVVTHPISDAMCDEFPFFAWALRYEAFKRFGYDPDGVFSLEQDAFGFARGRSCEVFLAAPCIGAAAPLPVE
jgi:hypothetical protein